MHSSYCKAGVLVKLLLALWQTLQKVQWFHWFHVFRGVPSVFSLFFDVCQSNRSLFASISWWPSNSVPISFWSLCCRRQSGGRFTCTSNMFVDLPWRNLFAIKLTFCWIASGCYCYSIEFARSCSNCWHVDLNIQHSSIISIVVACDKAWETFRDMQHEISGLKAGGMGMLMLGPQ